MPKCWIALGGNMGRVAETFQRALELLDQTAGVSVGRVSQNYTTAPMGVNAGEQFLNAAAELHTSLTPEDLLHQLQSVETQLGRVRTARWGARTLDLDLLLFADEVIDSAWLTVPHPHLWYRRFVLDPLVEIAADVIHPRLQLTIAELRHRLLLRPLPCVMLGGETQEFEILQRDLSLSFPQVEWMSDRPQSAWLQFRFGDEIDETARSGVAPPDARQIDVRTIPTSPRETLHDILTAALDAAQVVNPSR